MEAALAAGMRNTRFLLLVPTLLTLNCGGTIEEEGEELGAIVDRDPWDETMATAAMETVAGVAAAGACSTAPLRGLSDQIVAEMNCLRPNLFSRIDGANVSFTGAGALPYLQTPAAAALRRATQGHSRLGLNSTLRTLPQQWVLRNWADTRRCGVQRAALPSQSNHEDGLAIDTSSYNSYKGLLTGQGFRWFGSGDAVHFDFVGGGGKGAPGVLAFQRLWNRNHPGDRIAEDGAYGPQTGARVTKSPRAGFAKGASCR